MNVPVLRKRPLVSFVVLSGLAHLFCLGIFAHVGSITFVAPVIPPAAVSVTLTEPDDTKQVHPSSHTPVEAAPHRRDEGRGPGDAAVPEEPAPSTMPPSVPKAEPEQQATRQEQRDNAAIELPAAAAEADEGTPVAVPAPQTITATIVPPLRRADEFLATTREKLTYRITMLGLPIGEAVIEAAREQAGLHITTRVRSNTVISAVYPVDNLVETRLINGNYLVTKIRRREAGVASDTGFTLKFREKTAFWADLTRNQYANDALPREDVLDMLSGFYYLRTHRLEVGKSVELHLYDSNEYAPTTVEVLRRERVTLPGFRKVDALVVHPLLKTEGFFRRSGDVLVWLTDDEYKVPIKMETTIAIGRVTAELISVESDATADVDIVAESSNH